MNTFTTGNQRDAAIAIDATGDFVVVWGSDTQDGSGEGIYAQFYSEATDSVGPTITNLLIAGNTVDEHEQLVTAVPSLTVVFSEDLSTSGVGSVTKTSNWQLTQNGVVQSGKLGPITFGKNSATGKYEAVIAIDGSPLTVGDYVLTALETITDLAGNPLDGNSDGTPGGDFSRSFKVRTPVPVGDEFQIHTHPGVDQFPGGIAMDDAGNFVTTWTSNQGQDGDGYGVYARRYNASGDALSPEFLVSTWTTGNQVGAIAAMTPDGQFVITWTSLGTSQDGDSSGVFAQRYDANGMAVGGEFQVNTATAGDQKASDIVIDKNGDFVIVWTEYYTDRDGDGSGIFAQRFSADGVKVGNEFQVNTTGTNEQRSPDMAISESGDFVVTWTSYVDNSRLTDVFAQRFNNSGEKVGTEFLVNQTTTRYQSFSSVAMDLEGNFVVTWGSDFGSTRNILSRRFDSNGIALSDEFQVNTTTMNISSGSSIAMDDDGDFVVAWQQYGLDGDAAGIFAQRFNREGTKQGTEFLVNSTTIFFQVGPVVALDSDGDFIIGWASYGQDSPDYGVYAQRYRGNVAPEIVPQSPIDIDEHLNFGTSVTTVAATDADPGDHLTYSLSGGNIGNAFTIDPRTGEITVNKPYALDFESQSTFTLRVAVTDEADVTSKSTVTVNINDINEQPAISPQSFSVFENSTNGSMVGMVMASDPDTADSLTYSITGGNISNAFVIDAATGEISVNKKSALDFESVASFSLSVAVTDQGNLTRKAIVTVNVIDINDPPVIADQMFSVDESSPNGTVVGTVVAADADAGDSLTYSITGGNVNGVFDINSSTGEISVAKRSYLDFEALSTYALSVAVVDQDNVQRKATVTVNVNDTNEQPLISPQMFTVSDGSPNGTSVGLVISTVPVTFAITGGNVGKAFAIDSQTGEITIAKSTSLDTESFPSYELSIQAVDSAGQVRKAVMSIQVTLNQKPQISPQDFTVTENSPTGTVVGTVTASDADPGTQLTFAITGGNIGRAFAINAMTGEITVNNSLALDFETTPTFNVSVQVTDSRGVSRKAVMTINLLDTDEETGLFSSDSVLTSFVL